MKPTLPIPEATCSFFEELILDTGLAALASLTETETTLLRMTAMKASFKEMARATGLSPFRAARMRNNAKRRLANTIRELVNLERSAGGRLLVCESLLVSALNEVRKRTVVKPADN